MIQINLWILNNDFIVKNARLVVDTRNAVKKTRKNVVKA
jgi:hypothetical protein